MINTCITLLSGTLLYYWACKYTINKFLDFVPAVPTLTDEFEKIPTINTADFRSRREDPRIPDPVIFEGPMFGQPIPFPIPPPMFLHEPMIIIEARPDPLIHNLIENMLIGPP